MYFTNTRGDHSIDLAAALTAYNRKQYHQTKNLKPLAYHFRAQCVTTGSDADPIVFSTAPNTWTTRNAVTMLGAMYRKQLSSNNLRIGQLPKYGREMRLALKTTYGYDMSTGSDGFGGSATLDNDNADGLSLIPTNAAAETIFTSYSNTDGATANYYTANDLTVISVPEATADGEPETVVPALVGTSDHDGQALAVIPEYLASRRNAHDHAEVDHDLPSDTSLLLRIGSAADEHFDDVIDAIEETGDQRPYDEAGANKLCIQGALMAAGDYCSGVAPLGLISVTGNTDAKYLITVTAITEM